MLAIGEPALRIISIQLYLRGRVHRAGLDFPGAGPQRVLDDRVVHPAAGGAGSLWRDLLARVGQRVGNDNLVWLSYPIAEVFSLAVTLILFTKLYRNVIMEVPLHGEENEPANF